MEPSQPTFAQVLRTITDPQLVDPSRPVQEFCRNPFCLAEFIPEPGNPDSLFCASCDATLTNAQKADIRFYMAHGVQS